MKDDLLAIWVSFVEMVIRFFSGRFKNESEEVNYLRVELDKSRLEREKLLGYILEMANPAKTAEENIDLNEFKPVNQHEPWHLKQRRLERESRDKAMKLAAEAREKTERVKTTEQLESELLSGAK